MKPYNQQFDKIPLSQAVFVWTPLHMQTETSGKITVVPHPVPHRYHRYTHSSGADGFGWKQDTDANRIRRFKILLRDWVMKDKLDEGDILEAMRTIADQNFIGFVKSELITIHCERIAQLNEVEAWKRTEISPSTTPGRPQW